MKREFLTILFIGFFIFISHLGFSQTSISGIVNSYAAVDSVYPTKDTIEISNPSLFTANDTVMIYQVKGAEPRTEVGVQPYNFGQVRNATELKKAGKYEIILIQDIDGNKAILKSVLNNDYDTDDFVQIIKVPSYKSASVDGRLTCEPWDKSLGYGGVVVLMVGDTLYLNEDIDVIGKGFMGAAPFESNGECASVDSTVYSLQYFNENRDTISAGFKGEGIAKFDTTYRKGLGRWANGGGGGNARYAGGGGGGNDGAGGYGGEEDTTTCITPNFEDSPLYDFGGESQWRSLGGSDGYGLGTQFLIDDSTIFMGGGGGSGTYTGVLTASNGGDGGGVVIIMAKVLVSNGDSIIADGADVEDIATASAGGGGAGGTVVFDVETVSGDLTISINGGDGGRVATHGNSGPGGGGGGGPLLYNYSVPNIDYTLTKSGGSVGYAQNLYPAIERHKALPGQNGATIKAGVKVPLTGFLFNWISDDQVICRDQVPNLISGTEPRGGDGSYTYEWKEGVDSTSLSTISGAVSKDYQPPALTDTTYYQRIVTSSGGSIIDKGNIVQIIVQDPIVNNFITGDDLITCLGNQADTITGTTIVLNSGGDNFTYEYFWQQRTDQGSWSAISLLNDTICLPGTVLDTTYVRRIVKSGACYDTTANIEIIGLPQITNNIITENQEICEDQVPEEIIGTLPDKGDGTYSYYWEKRTEGTSWTIITDSLRKNFAPSNLIETTYYRRAVQSDDCIDISDSIKINVLVPIGNDYIENGSKIYTCYNTQPELILGSTPINGDGTYRYQWQESTDGTSWNNVTTDGTNEDYQPETLIDTTFYRRLVVSGQDDCCSSISDTLEVNINLLPVAVIVDDLDTICSGDATSLEFKVTSGTQPYTLTYSDGFSTYNINSINTTDYFTEVVNPLADIESKQFDYTLISVVDDSTCQAVDLTGHDTVIVYGIPTAFAGIDDEVCSLSYTLSATPIFGNGIWTQIPNDGETQFSDMRIENPFISVDSALTYNYIWSKTNWNCNDADTVEISMYENLTNIQVISPDDSIASVDVDTIIFNVLELPVKGSYENNSFSDVIYKAWRTDNSMVSISDSLENEANYSWSEESGIGKFKVEWYVRKGVCQDTTIGRTVEVRDYIFVPNGFTPNGDGVNDVLFVYGLNENYRNELIIYNRWGTEVYRMDNYSNQIGWDGKNNDGKDLSEDTYYYVLYKYKPSGTVTETGFIVLKRF